MLRIIFLFALLAASLVHAAPNKPKLVLTVVIDQFRYDYLTRFRADYTAGLARLLNQGAVLTNAYYPQVPTVTAVGHSTILTGAIPSISGIVANEWYDRDEKAHVTSVSDARTQLLGGTAGAAGASPSRLLVSTVGDELKLAGAGKPRVVGISLKDRSAILTAGRMADGAFWFDTTTGNFVSSTYYYKELPAWAKEFNARRPADKYLGVTWLGHKLPDQTATLFTELEYTPFGNELMEQFVEKALAAEALGTRGVTDVLALSFSSNDYVGHRYGPDSPEVRDVTLATDKLLARLFAAVEKQVGVGNYLVVLTSDHGVSPVPEVNAARRMPGGRIDPAAIKATVQAALARKYGPGDWVAGNWDLAVYLNQPLIANLKLDLGAVQREAAAAIQAIPHVARVYTLNQMLQGNGGLRDVISQKVANGYHPRRGPDVELVPDPYWFVSTSKTSHATPYDYDAHVPVIFMGQGIRPGRYLAPVVVNDIAPTLASMLEIAPPSGSVGRVLTEILVN
ncbi:MAG: alkaline phosphatase family protein [Candidatus Solibacter sp.]